VPAHWETGSLRWLSRRYSGGTPDKTNLSYWEEGTVPWLNSGAVNDRLIFEPSAYITEEAFANSSTKWVPKGALVMALAGQGKTKGMVAQLAIPSTCNQSMAAIIPAPAINARFLFWWLESNYQNIRNMAGGDLRDGLNLELLGNISCPLPPLPEQTAIASFLDHETGKIDVLVEEQRRLIALLKEKRQAVISHAVTKGLNPLAPLKPSGVEWLGDVPVHWELFSLKRDLDFLTSGSRGWAENYSDEGDIFIRITNLTRDGISIDLSDIQRVAVPDGAEGARTRVQSGDVLFSITAYLGSVAVIPETFETAYVSQHIALARLRHSRLIPRWVGYVALSIVGKTWFQTQSYGGTKIQLSLDDVRDLPIPAPPIEEQHEIVSFITNQVFKFDTLTAEAHRAIDLLQERRTALISAAVTGKIDVRSFHHG
jgi:type I restriction enzyme S subunit